MYSTIDDTVCHNNYFPDGENCLAHTDVQHTDHSHERSPVFPPWSEKTACSQSLFPQPVTCDTHTHTRYYVTMIHTPGL